MPEAVSSPALALPSWAHKIRKAVWVGLGLVVLLVAAILTVPAFVDLGLFKRTYLPLVEDALNRRVDVGEVRLSLIPTPSIRLSKLRVSDGPSFADNTLFSAQQVQLRLKLMPLIRGRFEIIELVLDRPVFTLLKRPDGSFNYSDIAGKRASGARRDVKKRAEGSKTAESAAIPLLIPGRMRVRDGQVNIITKGQSPVNLRGIDLSLQEFSSTGPFPYRASFEYPGLKTISLEGQLDYQEDKVRLMLIDNRLKIQDLTLPVSGSVSNLATAPRLDLKLNGDNLDAKPIFQILSVFGLAPRDTEVSGPMGLKMSVTGPSNHLVTQVRGLFKDVKVHGKRALKGNLSGQVSISVPVGGGAITRRLQGDGKLVARDGELTNVDLVKKIQRVTGMIGLSKDERREATTFKTLEADFILGGGYAEFTRLYLVNPQIEVNGNGTMTLEQPALDIAITAALSPQASGRAGRGRTTQFLKDKEGRLVVPLKVTGPVENPAVNLNSEKLIETGVPRQVEKGFGSFFKQLFRNR
jgi:AsmA protein